MPPPPPDLKWKMAAPPRRSLRASALTPNKARPSTRTGGDHAMACGVFESVLDLQRSFAPLRKGAMQELSGVFERRRAHARRTERQHTRAAR